MRKVPITIAHMLPFPAVGGTELATLRAAQAVEGDQFRSVAFCTPEASPVRDLFAGSGFETHTFSTVEPSIRSPREFLRASWKLARELRSLGVGLLHCSDYLAAHYTAIAGRMAGLPILCHVRNRQADISRRNRTFIRPVNRFVFVSRETWRHFGYSVARGRGSVLYDGIDVSPERSEEQQQEIAAGVRREFGIPGDSKIVGMIARVAPQKDFQTLIKSARILRASHPKVRFLVVGDFESSITYQEQYAKVKSWLEQEGVAGSFIFTGFRRDVPRLMAALDIFVLSTHYEGLPLVILEAMAEGKPVVATSVDGISEIVNDKETGFLYPHGDHRLLADRMLSLLEDENLARTMGMRGREAVNSGFTRMQFKEGLERVYRELVLPGVSAPSAGGRT